jgi:hypothetical protein
MSESAVWGIMHWGNFRWGIYAAPAFITRVFADLKQIDSQSVSVAWLERVPAGSDPATGKPIFTWAERQIDVYVQNLSVGAEWLSAGVTPVEEIRIYCLDGVKQLDRVVWADKVFEVKHPPQEFRIGQSFMYRTLTCERLKT